MAVHYGADAVYLAGKAFSLRNFSANFSLAEMQTARRLTREKNVRMYVAVNIYSRDSEARAIADYLESLAAVEPGRPDRCRPGRLHAGQKAPASPRPHPHEHPGQHHQHRHGPLLAGPGSDSGQHGPGIDPGRDPTDGRRERYRGRSLCPRCHVHGLFGPLSAVRLHDQPGEQPRHVQPTVPVPLYAHGTDPARAVLPHRRRSPRGLHLQFPGSLHDRASATDDRCRYLLAEKSRGA